MAQERSLDDFRIHRVVSLLARTDMTFAEIGEFMGCGNTVVADINRQYEVRDSAGRRQKPNFKRALLDEVR